MVEPSVVLQHLIYLPLDPLQQVTAQASLQGAQVAFLVALWLVLDQPLQHGFGSDHCSASSHFSIITTSGSKSGLIQSLSKC